MLNHLEVIRRALILEGIAREFSRMDGTYQYQMADTIDSSIDPRAAEWLAINWEFPIAR